VTSLHVVGDGERGQDAGVIGLLGQGRLQLGSRLLHLVGREQRDAKATVQLDIVGRDFDGGAVGFHRPLIVADLHLCRGHPRQRFGILGVELVNVAIKVDRRVGIAARARIIGNAHQRLGIFRGALRDGGALAGRQQQRHDESNRGAGQNPLAATFRLKISRCFSHFTSPTHAITATIARID